MSTIDACIKDKSITSFPYHCVLKMLVPWIQSATQYIVSYKSSNKDVCWLRIIQIKDPITIKSLGMVQNKIIG